MSYSPEVILEGVVILFLYSLFFISGFILFGEIFPISNNRKYAIQSDNYIKFVSKNKIAILIFTFFAIQLLIIAFIGPSVFMVKRSDFDGTSFGDNTALVSIIIGGARAFSFSSVVLLFLGYGLFNKELYFVVITITLIPFFIINYPLSLARFVFFAYILIIFFLFNRPTAFKKFMLFAIFFIGVTTIFPFFSFLTRGDENSFKIDFADYYTSSGDFDGLQSVLNTIVYTKDLSYEYGHQLLGSLLFFVPRAFWLDKPIPTGSLTAEHQGYLFTNISSPMPAELYIDFGYIGITIIAFLLGMGIRWIDQFTIYSPRSEKLIKSYTSAVFFSFSIIFFRGALMGIISIIVVQLIMVMLVLKLSMKKVH
jgi:oligosaccharide repeat unit polymerase